MTHGLEVAILGAGAFGREVLQYCQDAEDSGWPNRVVGFIDTRADSLEPFGTSMPILGNFGDIQRIGIEAYVIAVGDPKIRRELASAVDDAGGVLVSLVHPSAYIASTAHVEPGVVLCPHTLLAANSSVGPNVAINVFASIGHDSRVGAHCVISPYAAVTGNVLLGDESFLGTHCTVAPGVSIGSGSKVSAGSVVVRDAEPGSLLAGNPAKSRVMYSQDRST